MQSTRNLNICVIAPDNNAYSETFIRAHVEKLPGTVHFLYGGALPIFQKNGTPLVPSASLGRWFIRLVLGKLFKFDFSQETLLKKAIKKYFKENNIDVVLAEYGPTGVAVESICQDLNIPLAVHFHGYDAFEFETTKKYKEGYKKLFNAASAIISGSHSMQRQLMSLGAKENMYQNYLGVDSSLFLLGDPELSPPTFLAVGRFVDKKAPYLTILAFQKMLKEFPTARLILCGDGPLREACKQLVKVFNIADRVEFKGISKSTEVASLMRDARAFVQHSLTTSYGDSESLGVVFLEAGISGIPVVATQHDGIPEVIVHGQTGFLVDEGDVNGMAKCMLQLAQDPLLAGRLGKAARERISREFNMDKSITGLYRILKSAVENKKDKNIK